jgi:uncharacterized protein (TIGR00106 family)
MPKDAMPEMRKAYDKERLDTRGIRMIIAELSVVPVGTKKASVSEYVGTAVKELKSLGLEPRITAMGTDFEARDIKTILIAFQKAHEAVFRAGAERVVTQLKIDERRDREGSMAQKLNSAKSRSE